MKENANVYLGSMFTILTEKESYLSMRKWFNILGETITIDKVNFHLRRFWIVMKRIPVNFQTLLLLFLQGPHYFSLQRNGHISIDVENVNGLKS